ncbi:MAG: 16S rRNA (adenine(1518)-N(6)/adenine(1519)-N(6))-dimethyltransferase RsmA [Proteobacteria bacterium]|nr:16S rRNA (adenine(1518)-N(6)/adenine(1519)-N(6))-dimethyltransferase RsmA [Pseudomonadota bacterium]HQR04287.1 16S rRNA (adenine(1518)-N(6)/adenine(1519)-N(6))-dimethyltransferase RsmA [Rhodocyclaceae bacterium]
MKHIPRKRFGQNFLNSQGVINDILNAICPRPDDALVEIGPGLAALTAPLLQIVRHLHVVEIDRDLIARLRQQFSSAALTIHEGDALEFDFSALGNDLRIVGNLPYNISTPLLFHLAQYAGLVRDMHFMLQKEVVDRMVAGPGGREFGRLSVMLQYRFHVESLFIVPPDAFTPAPKVDSAIVRLIPKTAVEMAPCDPDLLAQVVTTAFSQRRKMLRNTLRDLMPAGALEALNIDPTVRAEELEIADFVRIANTLAQKE